MNDAIVNTTSIYDYGIRNTVLVCEINDKTVACASHGIFRAWDAYKFSVEHSIYVHKNFQGQGIGSSN